MMYPTGRTRRLGTDTFRNPPAQFGGAPFWAWNGRLERDQPFRRLAVYERVGLASAHMHVRVGLETPYLSDEFMDLICAAWRRASTSGCGRSSPARTGGHPAPPEDWQRRTSPRAGSSAGRRGVAVWHNRRWSPTTLRTAIV